MAILIACLDCLFDEYDDIAPGRDTTTDGWIGDAAHADSTSDHNPDETGSVPIYDADTINEVHAIDVDKDLKEDVSMEDTVQHILSRCRSGQEKRLRYIIYNRRIWEASNGWKQRDYTGSNPHDKHAHYSGSYETKYESSTASWTLEDLMGLSSDDLTKIENIVKKYVGDVVDRWNTDGGRVPESDPNQQMTVASSLYYIGRDVAYTRDRLVDDPATLTVEGARARVQATYDEHLSSDDPTE